MWPKRPKRPRVANNVFSAYLRGRVCGAGIGGADEATLYSDDELPLAVRVAFAIGATSRRRAPILSVAQLEQAVRDRFDFAAMVAEVEDPGPAAPPPA